MKLLFMILTLGIFYTPTYEEILLKVSNSSDMKYMLSFFEYKKDKIIDDEWKSPQEFIKSEGGDCEDYAILVFEVLSKKGYDCNIYGLYRNNDQTGHCVATYRRGLDWGYFSNHKRYKYQMIEDISEYDYHHLHDWKTRQRYFRNEATK